MTSSTNKSSSSFKNIVSAADRALLEERYEFVPSQSHAATESATSAGNPATTNTTTNHENNTTWQDRMVQNYQDGLYREYALADLSRPGQLGLRWRTQQEVMTGRGERSCGNKHCGNRVLSTSNSASQLVTVEVPFAYIEGGMAKKELVKLNLCPTCLPLVQPKAPQGQHHRRPQSSNDSQSDDTDGTTESLSQSNSNGNRNILSSSSSSSSSLSSSSSSSPKKKRRRRPKDRHRRKHHKHSKRFKQSKR